MKRIISIVTLIIVFANSIIAANDYFDIYPNVEISNKYVKMRLYLPNVEKGYYRATRFDWSGVIAKLEYNGHNYFGEWKDTHDPLFHEDLTGTAEGYINAGLGFDEAKPGEEFVRIGVGVLIKPDNEPYISTKTYTISDNGKWKVKVEKDWIEFIHTINTKYGYAYIYTKKIELFKNSAGYVIKHSLKNTGVKTIETDQFNHNFFTIDDGITGPDYSLTFPFKLTKPERMKGKEFIRIEENQIVFFNQLPSDILFAKFKDVSNVVGENGFELINGKSGAGVKVALSKPMYNLVFWAQPNVICPENSVYIRVESGKTEYWESNYHFFESTKN